MLDAHIRLAHTGLHIAAMADGRVPATACFLRRVRFRQAALEIDVMRFLGVANLHQMRAFLSGFQRLGNDETDRLIRVPDNVVLQYLNGAGRRPTEEELSSGFLRCGNFGAFR